MLISPSISTVTWIKPQQTLHYSEWLAQCLTLSHWIFTPDVIHILGSQWHSHTKRPQCPSLSLYELCGHGALTCVSIYVAWSLYNFTPLFITQTLTTSRSWLHKLSQTIGVTLEITPSLSKWQMVKIELSVQISFSWQPNSPSPKSDFQHWDSY